MVAAMQGGQEPFLSLVSSDEASEDSRSRVED